MMNRLITYNIPRRASLPQHSGNVHASNPLVPDILPSVGSLVSEYIDRSKMVQRRAYVPKSVLMYAVYEIQISYSNDYKSNILFPSTKCSARDAYDP